MPFQTVTNVDALIPLPVATPDRWISVAAELETTTNETIKTIPVNKIHLINL